ncbi:MAG: RNA methyltransferase [Deltaproteobacteria bacterium]|nr:MAG: RNA methyltransferase [Deltaproteobacteria bacterium]
MIGISDIDDPRVSEFRSLKGKNLLRKNLMVVEGEKVVLKLLKSSIKITKIFAPKTFIEKHPLRGEIFFADKSLMGSIVGHHLHQGIMALAVRPEDVSLRALEFPALILNGVTSPENIGSIIRSAAAFKVKSIIVGPKSCSPYLRRCIRVSMGNIFSMDIHHSNDLQETLRDLKTRGIKIFATANIEGACDLPEMSFNKDSALVIGSEGLGIEKYLIELCDIVVRIPIDSEVAHLNVGTATSIFLYKLHQDLLKSSH